MLLKNIIHRRNAPANPNRVIIYNYKENFRSTTHFIIFIPKLRINLLFRHNFAPLKSTNDNIRYVNYRESQLQFGVYSDIAYLSSISYIYFFTYSLIISRILFIDVTQLRLYLNLCSSSLHYHISLSMPRRQSIHFLKVRQAASIEPLAIILKLFRNNSKLRRSNFVSFSFARNR